jgi:hypothetical protein
LDLCGLFGLNVFQYCYVFLKKCTTKDSSSNVLVAQTSNEPGTELQVKRRNQHTEQERAEFTQSKEADLKLSSSLLTEFVQHGVVTTLGAEL